MFVEQMQAISARIIATPASQVVQALDGYIAAVQSVHILAITLVMGSAAMLNLRVLGVMNRGLPLANAGARFRRPLWIGVGVLILSGLALLLAEPERSLVSRVFQLKMVLLVAAVVLTLLLQHSLLRHAAAWDAVGRAPLAARVPALVSLGLWVCIIFAGRWIAYAQY